MTRFTTFFVAMLLLVSFAWAKKGGNGGGGGGNGGGGGGGGGGGELSGVLYVHLSTPTGSFEGAADPVGSFALNTDGTTAQALTDLGDWPPLGEVSHDTHAGAYVFLSSKDVAGANPDGSSKQVLAATLEDGTVVELTTAGDSLRIVGPVFWPAVRWSKDDTSVSFAAIVWDGASVASTHIFEAPVAWDSDGVPSLSDDPSVVVDGTMANGESSLDGHDWSPDGTQLVYEDGSAIVVVTLASGATTTVANAGEPGPSGGDPRWSPAAGSDRIAYVDAENIHLVDASGANGELLASNGYAPQWSPDAAHVAFARDKTMKIKGRWNYTTDVLAVSATGGSPSSMTGSVDDRVGRFRAWR